MILIAWSEREPAARAVILGVAVKTTQELFYSIVREIVRLEEMA